MNHHKEGRTSSLCASLAPRLYARTKCAVLRGLFRKWVLSREGGTLYSLTIREIYRRFHGVDVGLYTIGPCEVPPGNLAPGTIVGRYCSIYYTVRALDHDPANTESTHGLVPHYVLGESNGNKVHKLLIGNDVFMGHNVTILPSTEEIGDGAVIGAGSVVRTRVPPYAVVTGNPARVVRFRFSESKIKELLDSKWWLKSIDELGANIEEFQKPLEGNGPIR
jgi:virginiamycin A acetyltransferase